MLGFIILFIEVIIIVAYEGTTLLFVANILLKQVATILVYLVHFLLGKFTMTLVHSAVGMTLFLCILRSCDRLFNIGIDRLHLCLRLFVFNDKVFSI